MFKKVLWTIVFVFSLMLNQIALADSAICEASLKKLLHQVNLDADQKAKIKPILDQLKSDMASTGSQMQGLEDQMMEQTSSPNMDQSKVDNLVDTKTKLIGDMMKARIKAQNQIFAILKPEQKEKLKNLIKKADQKIASEFKNCEKD